MLKKYKETILYVIFGVTTTAVDWIVYTVSRYLGVSYFIATFLSWFTAVLFAFITNRSFVFVSKSKGLEILKECVEFFISRLASGAMNLCLMMLFVDVLHINEFISKAVLSVLVMMLNYLLSKFLIFKK